MPDELIQFTAVGLEGILQGIKGGQQIVNQEARPVLQQTLKQFVIRYRTYPPPPPRPGNTYVRTRELWKSWGSGITAWGSKIVGTISVGGETAPYMPWVLLSQYQVWFHRQTGWIKVDKKWQNYNYVMAAAVRRMESRVIKAIVRRAKTKGGF
jgi:hypothetical protein